MTQDVSPGCTRTALPPCKAPEVRVLHCPRTPAATEVSQRRRAPSASPPPQQRARRPPGSAHIEPEAPATAQRIYTPPKAGKSSKAKEVESAERNGILPAAHAGNKRRRRRCRRNK